MKEPEMELIAGWIAEILTNIGKPDIEQKVRKQVAELAARFPVYESRMNASAVPARV
jgi:glycine hydroxymethyltransferase